MPAIDPAPHNPIPESNALQWAFTRYLYSTSIASKAYDDRISAILDEISEFDDEPLGDSPFSDYWRETLSEFTSMLTSEAVPEYGKEWIRAYHAADDWVNENVVGAGRRAVVLAFIAKQGIDRVETIIENLAASARAKPSALAPAR